MWWEPVVAVAIFPGVLTAILLAFFYQWFDRRVAARMQNRYGPIYVGKWGLLQPIADFVKLMTKQDITPKGAVRPVFTAVPIIYFALVLYLFFYIPITGITGLVSFQGDLLLFFAVTTFEVLFTTLGGWSSRSPYSQVGGIRGALQLLGYETPLELALLLPAVLTGSFRIADIVEYQVARGVPLAGPLLIAFILAFIGLQAEMERLPFDVPEAETEIVAGWLTEYSGKKLALLRLAADIKFVVSAGLIVALFLGGPYPLVCELPPMSPWLETIVLTAIFLAKLTAVIFVFTWLKVVMARFRIDQVLHVCWTFLVPLAVLQLVLVYGYLTLAPFLGW